MRGRGLDSLPVVHSLFETSALAEIIEHRYCIGPVSSFELYRSYVNDVYRLQTADGTTYFLKIARTA